MFADKDTIMALKRLTVFKIINGNPARVLAYVNQQNLFTLAFDLKVPPEELLNMTVVYNDVDVYDITNLLLKWGVKRICGVSLREAENKEEENEKKKREMSALFHPTYRKARERFQRVQEEQIMKGAEKYSEPLNHESWSFEDLQNHAMQELVDQVHYVEAMGEKFKYLQGRLKQREDFLSAIRTVANNTHMNTITRIQAIKDAFDRMEGGGNDGDEK